MKAKPVDRQRQQEVIETLGPARPAVRAKIQAGDTPGQALARIRRSLRPIPNKMQLSILAGLPINAVAELEGEYSYHGTRCYTGGTGCQERRREVAHALRQRGAERDAVNRWLLLCGILPTAAREALMKDWGLTRYDLGPEVLVASDYLGEVIEDALNLRGVRQKRLVRHLQDVLRGTGRG